MSAIDPARARGFDAWAGDYQRFRPGYPDAVFDTIADRLALPARPDVVDLGAGTGRASLAMAARGWRVTAVEPGGPMLDLLRARGSEDGLVVSTVQASAESTGLDPESADLVTAAQAFHWFDKAAALTEMARILEPGGGVALFWNVRERERSAFLAAYEDLLQQSVRTTDAGRYEWEGQDATRTALDGAAGFEPAELTTLRHEVKMTAEQFVGMAFTASYVRTGLVGDEQARFRDELGRLLDQHGLGDAQPFVLPYRVDLWIARRRGS